ncbi:protein phosphatase 1 regulatory subunit 37 isoform X2 [Macrosteles quadrilineatus]|uniref:protein phosphatase 1 regulatory subunit 37 isoform X2 n=1 Tax=Macrosteles quadrilineatus TaxID=74068 RepID=UPI0023E17650|nr:protein phosphatase 1 regulatory subunit 37 isoform X2 [Macrosteles quadrilineatus]
MSVKTDQLPEQALTTLTAGSVPSCLRNRNDPPRKHPFDRRVSFPEDDQQIVTGFLEPANPWEFADSVTKDDLVAKYVSSCEKHGARPISRVITQLQNLDYDLDRNEMLDLKDEMLGPAACESLEEILKRIQFITINLEGTNLDDESSVALFDMMEYYESAVRLNITGNHCIAARGWQACSRMIKRTKCLEELDARNTTLNEQFMPILSRALRLSTQLHVLKLENCNLSGRPIIILAAALKLNTGLKELYLGENYLVQNDAAQLSALLKVNTVLQLLDISNNNVQDEGLNHIVEGLLEQSSAGGGLQVLVMWNNHLSRKCGPHLTRMFAGVPSLETVNIGQNVLSNEVLQTTKQALQQNRSLLRLGMQSTHLSCEGAVALAEIIADNTTIQRIDLRDNNLQVAGLMALVLSMRVNRSVSQLDLDDTPRRKHSMGPALDEYMKLVSEIRGHCETNSKRMPREEDIPEVKEESLTVNIEKRPRAGSFVTRKISLTCETLARTQAIPPPDSASQLLEPKRGGRLRSPAPSPIPSPVASPSPTRSRFQVSRVAESDSPVTPPSSSPNVFFGSGSRFKVTVVDSGAPATPTVLTSNNITVGFETPAVLSPSVSVSPAPSPTPIPAPLLSSIPSLFSTPMPSPLPSPGASPNPSPTYISPLSTINVGDTHLSPNPSSGCGENKTSTPSVQISHQVSVIVSDSTLDESEKDNFNDVFIDSKEDSTSNNMRRDLISDSTYTGLTSSDTLLDSNKVDASKPFNYTDRSSVSPPKVCKMRSESEDSEKDSYINRKLPKAADSLDLSAIRVMKQASVNVPEKPSTTSQRVRKISSWVQPSAMFSAITQDDTGKAGSSLERLLGLFTNPFSRSKTEDEPAQLERVPELAEDVPQKYDTAEVNSDPRPSVQIERSVSPDTSLSENVTNNAEIEEKQDSIKDYVCKSVRCDKSEDKSDNVGCPTSNGCEPKCDKDVNIYNYNNNEEDASEGVKCETWPQGTSMAQLSLIHQGQSQSSPCLTALVFLKGNNLSGLQRISPSSEDKVDAANNISLAL